jgi:hypothetical protein
MKSPPIQYSDDEARRMVDDFIASNQPVAEEKQMSEPIGKI